MEQLIKITITPKGNQAVSARELYEFLEVKDHFTQWTVRMFEYGFTKGVDYQAVNNFVKHDNGIGGTNKTDYVLTLECAKEIAMLQRTEKGKQARQYFIECEKVAKGQSVKLPTPKELAQMLIEAENAKEQLELEKERLAVQNKEQTKALQQAAPKVQFVDAVLQSTGTVTSTVIAKELSMSAIAMHDLLKEKGFIYKTAQGQWVVKSPYDREGYAETRTVDYVGSNGERKFTIYTVWTQKGRAWIHSILNPKLQAKPAIAPIMPVVPEKKKFKYKQEPRLLGYRPLSSLKVEQE